MISVVVPLYNKESSVCQTLQTVLNQSYQDFEIVIVNDGSTDRSVEEAEKVKDSRIRIIHQSNAGVSAARNKGIAEAKGEYIAFLDADDEWNKDYLQTQYELTCKYPDCGVFACNYIFKDTQGKITPTILHKLSFDGKDGVLSNYFEVASNSHPPLWTSAVMVRKSALQAVGGFPVGIKSGEDLLTWAKLALRFKIAFSKESQASFNFDEGNFNEDQKKRKPEKVDYVGEELQQLYCQNPNVVGLKDYVGFWHKMRARIFLQKHCRKSAFKECCLAAKSSFNKKVAVFMVLSMMPYVVIDYIFKKLG